LKLSAVSYQQSAKPRKGKGDQEIALALLEILKVKL
jgi:hypothetical protein